MPLIPHVYATTYHAVITSGATRPCRFSCVNSDSQSHDYVVKFYGAIGSAVICESMASLLGPRLGVNVPECASVVIDPRMAGVVSDAEAHQNLAKHNGPHFGSKDIGPAAVAISEGYTLVGSALEQAIDIFAFDMLIQNPDRTAFGQVGMRNLLYRGGDLFPIDHEKAFSFIHLFGNYEPWRLRDDPLAKRHLFLTRLRQHAKSNTLTFDNFMDRLSKLTIEDVETMMQSLPEVWYDSKHCRKIAAHFGLVLANQDRFRKGLLEAVS